MCEAQQLTLKMIDADEMGRMNVISFEKQVDKSRPVLLILTLGTTFKGACDDLEAFNKAIDRINPPGAFRYVDAALFGGFLPYIKPHLIDATLLQYDAISISGHKFLGLDDPSGLFLCRRSIFDIINQNDDHITYLGDTLPTLTCSRSGLAPLKWWWKLTHISRKEFETQVEKMMKTTNFLQLGLSLNCCKSYRNANSNIVFFKRPSKTICQKYSLALGYDSALGGDLAHIVVMQHVTNDIIQCFLNDLYSEKKLLC